MDVGFEIIARDGATPGRIGRLRTPHGIIETPVFMPVGTRATVKGLLPEQLRAAGSTILLANAYHLALRPGAEAVAGLGGLHRMMGWDGPILTDSGGYQVFSLAELNDVDDDGVTFKSHIDGAPLRLDPETSIRVQEQLGADIIMAFDECPRMPCAPERMRQAVDRTIRWARRSRAAHRRPDQALFGIVQGGLDVAMRRDCLEALREIGFDGFALGGLSVGEHPDQMADFLRQFAGELPADRPRYLMGVGRPIDLIRAVAAGIDMFDCVLPTRNGRNAQAFVEGGVIRLRNARHRLSLEPLERGCPCYTCAHFSRGTLRHLFLAGEMLGPVLASLHNIAYYHRWIGRIREAIRHGHLAGLLSEAEAAQVAPGNEDLEE